MASGEKKEKERYVKETFAFKELFEREYDDMDWVKYGLPVGCVGGIVGAGSVGKSFKTLEDSMYIASGACEAEGLKRGGVLFLPAEDPIEEIGKRIKAIGNFFEYTPEMIDRLDANFIIWPLLGQAPNLMETAQDGETRPLIDAICDVAATKFKGDPVRLVVFDTLRRFSFADENDSGQMSQFLACMEIVSNRLHCASFFLHHASKNAVLNGGARMQQAARGSTVLSDNVRYQENLSAMTPDEAEKLGEIGEDGTVRCAIGNNRNMYVLWNVPKQNYGEPVADMWLKRMKGGVLYPVELGKFQKKKQGSRNGKEL